MPKTTGCLIRLAAAFALSMAIVAAPTLLAAQTPYLRVPTGEPKYTAIVMDARSGEVLYAERADSPRYPASVTKVMTLYLTFEALAAGRLQLSEMIVVSPHAAAQPATHLGLRAGASISVENAISAMTVHSANDMAVALAEHIGGTESRFAALMSLKAKQLGMSSTQYVNANGLPDSRQITSARDLAVLSRAVLHDFPQYYRFFSQQSFTYNGRSMVNTNHLLGKMPGVDGVFQKVFPVGIVTAHAKIASLALFLRKFHRLMKTGVVDAPIAILHRLSFAFFGIDAVQL